MGPPRPPTPRVCYYRFMSDAIKTNLKDLGEAVGKPVVSEIGQMLKEAGQSIIGTKPTDPAQQAQQKAEDEKRKQVVLTYLEEQRVRDKAAIEQQKAAEVQKEQSKGIKKEETQQIRQAKRKQKFDSITAAQTMVERRGRIPD